jgi:GAF domain-containing protein
VDNERARERVSVIEEIQDLLLTTDSIDRFLSDVARLAARELAFDTFCGITLQGEQGPATVASSDDRAARVDELQYTAGDGPCLQAMREGVQVVIDDFAAETRWPEYCIQATANGIRSSFSLPLRGNGFGKGALNLYAARPQFFGPPQREIAEHFAGEAHGPSPWPPGSPIRSS